MDTDSLLPPLFRFAYRMTGSVADAEDIVQECFLAALGPNSAYDASRTPIRTYLFGVARNQALKLLAKRPVTAEDGEFISDAPSPERAVFQPELEAAVARAVR
ncbi:MAG TPA: sigma-70 family RNA polymerase sigma factor, partial [Bryobacteraceae bacterium]|nr:sigma-70 family RNA polymerase sigma factor [Bryobacteraceae bacterium]